MKVSVIIPVYNGERYLRQCLDSVCGQTLRDIEIICVDDGSTDTSYQILEEYQVKDDRFVLLKQQNRYAGAARNLGKQHAKGEYLIFWDCDDYFELDALEVLYNRAKAQDADICVCGANHFFQNTEKLYPGPGYVDKKKTLGLDVFNRSTNPEYILNFTSAEVWNKLYRRSFVEKEQIDFQEIRNGNDLYFVTMAMCLAERITTIDRPLVTYRRNQASSLMGTMAKAAKVPFQAWFDVAADLREKDVFPEKSFVNKFLGSMLYLLRNLRTGEDFCEVVAFLKEKGLEQLGIKEQPKEYYYVAWHKEVVDHLLGDSPMEIRDFIAYRTYINSAETAAKLRLKNKECAELKKQAEELTRLKKKKIFKIYFWLKRHLKK